MLDLSALDFAKGNGLVTVVTQDAATGAVLMVAHADREALERTLATGEMLAAAPGSGCWWNGERCSVSAVSAIGDAAVLTTDERFANDARQRAGWRRLAREARVSRTWGDCYGYLLVSTGRSEVMVDGVLSPWDAAALMPIVEEAGGVFTDWGGTRTAFGGSAVATNRALASAARALLATPPGADAETPAEGCHDA